MLDKKGKRAVVKLMILILLLILVIRVFTLTLSKFESTSNSQADIDVAFYVLKKDYQSMALNLDSIFPQNAPYIYTFSVSNFDGTDAADIDIEYEIGIKTTTNLPLTYELYKNQNYTDGGATNIIATNDVEADENNTYFRKITTTPITLKYTTKTSNIYNLVVYFPGDYNTINYQDIIESIEITVNSNQVT